jgi:hypothetical protein
MSSDKSKGGRPRKLDEVITVRTMEDGKAVERKMTVGDRILMVVRAGNFPTPAAVACGVSERAFMAWMRAGREGKDEQFAQFYQAVKEAESEAEAVAVGTIMANPMWQAKAWFLERKFPDRWGQTLKVEQKVEQELEDAMERLRARLPHEVFQQVVSILADDEGGEAEAGEPSIQ